MRLTVKGICCIISRSACYHLATSKLLFQWFIGTAKSQSEILRRTLIFRPLARPNFILQGGRRMGEACSTNYQPPLVTQLPNQFRHTHLYTFHTFHWHHSSLAITSFRISSVIFLAF